ncbi:MAG: hypothetical protein RJA09_491, partial [Pseudomonadota bacterium]
MLDMDVANTAALEQAYNNRALVPDHPRHLAHWAQASAQARAALPCHLNLPYTSHRVGEAVLARTLDVYPAAGVRAGAGALAGPLAP